MPGLTALELQTAVCKALVELADGRVDGPGLATARALLVQGERRLAEDPRQVGRQTMTPKPPSGGTLTNRLMDSGPPEPRERPVLDGTNEWLDQQAAGE